MSHRWDRLLDLKTVTLVDALAEEAAKVLAEALLGPWPPPVEGLDLETGKEFASLFRADAERPPLAVCREGIRLARWDLGREFEAYDDYIRNRRYLSQGVAEEQRLALLFVSRYLIEQLLALGEATEGRVRRKDMAASLDSLDRKLTPT